MNTLPYIHANPKAANIQSRFFHDFSNYDTYERLTNDGLTKWHPAFLSLGKTLDECAKNYRGFCRKYKPRHKPEKRSRWGSRFLPKVKKKKKNKASPGQTRLPWADWELPSNLVVEVARQLVLANCYDPEVAMQFFDDQ